MNLGSLEGERSEPVEQPLKRHVCIYELAGILEAPTVLNRCRTSDLSRLTGVSGIVPLTRISSGKSIRRKQQAEFEWLRRRRNNF